jgi:2-dehydro-3-deoxyphosphogluconate aldolase/(4S)-4-hydroxy-2-oxoglutarate aldolase
MATSPYKTTDLVQTLHEEFLVAILRHDSGEQLADVAEALYEGGIRILEVTFTVPNAAEVINTIHKRLGKKIILGAGTILDPETARVAFDAGAVFAVAPNTNPELIQYCRRHGKMIIPGALTPTEICNAWEAGADVVKIFPSDCFGPSYLSALKRPLPQIRMMPTGGVEPGNVIEFIKAGAFAAGLGSSLVKTAWINERNFTAITEASANLCKIVKDFRS